MYRLLITRSAMTEKKSDTQQGDWKIILHVLVRTTGRLLREREKNESPSTLPPIACRIEILHLTIYLFEQQVIHSVSLISSRLINHLKISRYIHMPTIIYIPHHVCGLLGERDIRKPLGDAMREKTDGLNVHTRLG